MIKTYVPNTNYVDMVNDLTGSKMYMIKAYYQGEWRLFKVQKTIDAAEGVPDIYKAVAVYDSIHRLFMEDQVYSTEDQIEEFQSLADVVTCAYLNGFYVFSCESLDDVVEITQSYIDGLL